MPNTSTQCVEPTSKKTQPDGRSSAKVSRVGAKMRTENVDTLAQSSSGHRIALASLALHQH